jgi:hypothetical protein
LSQQNVERLFLQRRVPTADEGELMERYEFFQDLCTSLFNARSESICRAAIIPSNRRFRIVGSPAPQSFGALPRKNWPRPAGGLISKT